MYAVAQVHINNSGSIHAFGREFLSRVLSFCEKYDSDADKNVLFAEVVREMHTLDPSITGWVIYREDTMEVVAHCLVAVENYFGSRSVSVLQAELDEQHRPGRGVITEVWKKVKAYAYTRYIDRIKIMARNHKVARVFRRFYGFKESERRVMTYDISDGS